MATRKKPLTDKLSNKSTPAPTPIPIVEEETSTTVDVKDVDEPLPLIDNPSSTTAIPALTVEGVEGSSVNVEEDSQLPIPIEEPPQEAVAPPAPVVVEIPQTKDYSIVVALDVGNHRIKTAQGNQVRIADSFYAEVIHKNQVGELDEESAFVRYVAGDREDLIGRQWVTGNDAATYFSDTLQRAVDTMNNSGKVSLGLQLLLGNLIPPPSGDHLIIRYLFATLPDVEVLGKSFIDAVKGVHSIEQSTAHYQGVAFTVEIQEVVLKEEGQGAIAYALAKNICTPGAWNATIDFGGGTTIAQAYNERGQIVPSSRLVQSKGVNNLATAIASDERFRKHLGKEADVGLVLAAMRNESLTYGGQGYDFKEIFADQHRLWLQSIALPAFRKLLTLQDRLKTTLLIGGGANLAKSLERSSVVVCSRPDLANVEGLMILAKIRLGEAN